jgi:hypothetical protein
MPPLRAVLAPTVAVLSLLVGPLAAQTTQPATTRFGVYGGLTSASVSEGDGGLRAIGDAAFQRERRTGGQAGAFLIVPLGGALSLQPELHFVQKGVRFSGRLGGGAAAARSDVALNLGYLEAPLLLRVERGGARGTRPFLVLGPALAYNLSCGIAYNFPGFGGSVGRVDCDVSDAFSTDPIGLRSLDVGALVGGGVAFVLGGREYSLGARYTAGVRDIAEIARGARTGTAAVLLGITF